jgi:hypothetical protein
VSTRRRFKFSDLHWVIVNAIVLAILLLEGFEFIRWKMSNL